MTFQPAGYCGDLSLGSPHIALWFSTHADDGTPLTLVGAAVEARGVSQDTRVSGLELHVDAGGPGCHQVTVEKANSPESWAGLGPSWAVVLTAGTAGGVPLAGRVVGHFVAPPI